MCFPHRKVKGVNVLNIAIFTDRHVSLGPRSIPPTISKWLVWRFVASARYMFTCLTNFCKDTMNKYWWLRRTNSAESTLFQLFLCKAEITRDDPATLFHTVSFLFRVQFSNNHHVWFFCPQHAKRLWLQDHFPTWVPCVHWVRLEMSLLEQYHGEMGAGQLLVV